MIASITPTPLHHNTLTIIAEERGKLKIKNEKVKSKNGSFALRANLKRPKDTDFIFNFLFY